MMEFHVSRSTRDLYELEDILFGLRGQVIVANFNIARNLAQKMNARRDLVSSPQSAVRASDINAMGLIDEVMHLVVQQYRQQIDPNVFGKALEYLESSLGEQALDATLLRFAQDFPSVDVYRNRLTISEYFMQNTDGIPNRQVMLEEMLMLWLDNENPAFNPYRELFDHEGMVKNTPYLGVLSVLYDFFDAQPRFGPERENLIDMLRRPALESPDSLQGQLDFIRKKWGPLISEILSRLLSSLDFIREETRPVFGVGGPGPAQVLEFGHFAFEPENFSPDMDWMPRLVLIAKNSYVWLDQLSKKYSRPIRRLDEIPEEELITLARYGITGLWLIGLWERSEASQRIKQMRGNPEAVASAYSLYDYQIASALGGDEAYQTLRERAWQRGIRLSADMVPNHMGIDSRWVIEHPNWFIGLDYSPFPTYTFNGANLSKDDRVGIYLEDHYYNNSDAAVVFKRVDFWTGSARYIYHGNDGTSMPWNDTAQLDFLNPEVREAVIQTILHVARKFPVIRFDAAMTLSKKHFQRLWFPEPGSGGDIPTRAEFGLTRDQFDAAMPIEFWREVVDRIAQEIPDTLLLAEAFWMMEGYFVRTLGMHRVYNSAFMNMLRDEKNVEYRLLIKNTLEFDPEILKRYVNFMNNPDERTAVDQFGKGDKYIGICILMSTMPGLPMFGHGQIEGFSEKYGMEYQRAYWDEPVDQDLVTRHEREVFPLLRRRYQFAEIQNFLLYDFYTPQGTVDEDVFAYSNWYGDARSLVVYQNRYKNTEGWIRQSAAYMVKTDDDSKTLVQRHLAEGLGLDYDANTYTIYRDLISGLEYIRNNKELHERGLHFELHAYQYHVFVNFRQIVDSDWHPYSRLAVSLEGRGVPDIEEAYLELLLQPLHQPLRELANPSIFTWIIDQRIQRATLDGSLVPLASQELEDSLRRWIAEVKRLGQGQEDDSLVTRTIQRKLMFLLKASVLDHIPAPDLPAYKQAVKYLGIASRDPSPGTLLAAGDVRVWGIALSWLFVHNIGSIKHLSAKEASELSREWMDGWLLGKVLRTNLTELEIDAYTAGKTIDLIRILVAQHAWWQALPIPKARSRKRLAKVNTTNLVQTWLADPAFQAYIGVNQYNNIYWFNKEALEETLWWLFITAVVDIASDELDDALSVIAVERIETCYAVIRRILEASSGSEYQVAKLQAALLAADD
jgi:glycosidase